MNWGLDHSFPEVALWSLPLLVALALFLALAPLPNSRAKLISGVLRFGVWGGTIILLLRFAFVFADREVVKRPLAVAIDDSISMQLPSGSKLTRWEEVQAFLEKEGVWKVLRQHFQLRYFSLSEDLQEISKEGIESLTKPEGKSTRLHKNLAKLEEVEDWAGLLLFSDGVDTDQRSGKEGGEAKGFSSPVIALHPESEEGLKDVAIRDVWVPEVGFFKAKLDFDVEVEVHGYARRELTVKVMDGSRILDSRRISESEWKGNRARVTLSFSPTVIGSYGFEVEVTRLPGEVSHKNNRRALRLKVLRDRIRVLHVAGQPSWDMRFLREFLKQNASVDLISFFILRSPTDNPEAPQKALSLIPFPYHDLFTKELNNFDLIVFQDFDFRTYFHESYLGNIERYVRNGGGFAMVGGDRSFGKGEYRSTRLEQILPVLTRDDVGEIETAVFTPKVSKEGALHPIIAKDSSLLEFGDLPSFWGFHRVREVRSDAVVLLEHSTDRLGKKKAPIVALRQYGKGRTVAILVDSMWRWAFSASTDSTRMYQDLWNGLFRWMVQDPSYALLEIQPPDRVVAKDQLNLTVLAFKPSYQSRPGISAEVVMTQEENEVRKVISPTDREGKSQVSLGSVEEGLLRVHARVPGRESAGYERTEYVVVEPESREWDRRGVDMDYLGSIVAKNGGRVLPMKLATMADFQELFDTSQTRVIGEVEFPIWDHPLLLAFLLLAAPFEWWFRRRHGAP